MLKSTTAADLRAISDGSSPDLAGQAPEAPHPDQEFERLLAQLPPRRAAFVGEYVIDLNAKQAAIRAGYSRRTAAAQGSRLLSFVEVRQAIAAAKKLQAQRVEVTADRVVQELARIGFADMRDYLDWGPDGVTIKPSSALTPDQRKAVLEVRSTKRTIPQTGADPVEETEVKVRLHDKLSALDKLGKHLGLYQTEMVKPEDVKQFLAALLQVLQKWLPSDKLGAVLLDLKEITRGLYAAQRQEGAS